MKKVLLASLFVSSFAFAEDNQAQQQATTTTLSNKMTTKDAKKSCKDEGKAGAELIKCMKEKKEK